MAPEIFGGVLYNLTVDIYSAGAVVFVMCVSVLIPVAETDRLGMTGLPINVRTTSVRSC